VRGAAFWRRARSSEGTDVSGLTWVCVSELVCEFNFMTEGLGTLVFPDSNQLCVRSLRLEAREVQRNKREWSNM
jgi:hypothetical protein